MVIPSSSSLDVMTQLRQCELSPHILRSCSCGHKGEEMGEGTGRQEGLVTTVVKGTGFEVCPPQLPQSLCVISFLLNKRVVMRPGPSVQHLLVWMTSRLSWLHTQSPWQRQPVGLPCLGKGQEQGGWGKGGPRETHLGGPAQLTTTPFLERSSLLGSFGSLYCFC